jgi:hypothetical protein
MINQAMQKFDRNGTRLGRRPLQKRLAVAILAVAIYAIPMWAQSPRAKEIGTHLKCLCKGCDMSAGLCAHPGGAFSGPCDTAKAELREVDEQLQQGKTEQQIIDAFVREYGTVAYVEPPKHGFGLVAWLMPILYTVVGLALVVFVVRKWTTHRPETVSGVPAGADAISTEAFARARAQASRETDD